MDSAGQVQFRRWFPATSQAVLQARQWIAQAAAATGHDDVTSTLELPLLVSELATNAVRHSDSAGFLIEFDANARVVMAVCDSRATRLEAQPPHAIEPTGWTSDTAAEKVSDAWRVELHRDGTCLRIQLHEPHVRSWNPIMYTAARTWHVSTQRASGGGHFVPEEDLGAVIDALAKAEDRVLPS